MLQVRGLRKSYSGTEVVCGVDFSVAAGECYGLLGPNGAGKTTTPVSYTHLTLPTIYSV